jgi:signal transduction histidine kinase
MPIAKFVPESGRAPVRRILIWLRGDNPLRLVTLAIIALTLAVAVAGIWWLNALNRANTERELTNLSVSLSEHVDRTMQTIDLVLAQSLDRIRTHDLTDPADRLRLHLAFRDIAVSLAFVRTLAAFDADGWPVAISREHPAPEHNIADREYFRALRDGAVTGTYISRPLRSATTGEEGIAVSRAIIRPDGSFGGIVRVGLDMGYFQDFFSAIDLGPQTAVTLIRDDGILLMRSPPEPETIGMDLSNTPVFNRILVGREFGLTWHKSPVDGVWRVVAARRLPNAPLVVILSVPSSTTMANWRSQALVVGLGTAATILFLLWLAHYAGRQLAQRERRTRQALEAANAASRAKSSFLGVMSHELRTPLNAIIGFSEVISSQAFGPLANERYLDYVKDINQSGRNLLVLINQILDLSRIESGKHEMRMEGITLAEVWRHIGNEMGVAAAAKGIHLVLKDSAGDEGLVFAGDARATMQILSNLVSNAIKFTPEGGTVTVSTAAASDREIVIVVEDTGRGIPPDRLVDVLKPFVQVSDAHARDTGGVGLGLSICSSLAEAMGGRLKIESEIGKGTRVFVYLRRWVERR